MTGNVSFPSFGSLPLLGYYCIFRIHEILGRVNEFGHGLRFLLVKLVNEQIRVYSIVEGCQEQFVIYLVYRQGLPVKTSDEGPQAFILSLFDGQQAGRGTFMPLSPDKVVNKHLTQLFKRTYCIRGYFTEPHPRRSFEGGRKGSTHDLVRDPLQMHRSLESGDVVEWIPCSIIRI